MSVIYSYPYTDDGNDYILQCQKSWASLGHTIRPFNFRLLLDGVGRKDRVVVLNWIEDWMFAGRRPKPIAFALLLTYLLTARIGARRLIWVRHNILPNVANNAPAYRRAAIRLLGMLANAVVTHRPLPDLKTTFVPHPLYIDRVEDSGSDGPRDIEYLVFGHFRPSKSVDRLLQYWPPSIPLVLAGKSKNAEFASSLSRMMADRGMTVTWDDRLMPVEDLAGYLRRARFVVIVNNWDSVIVSGAFYHALSFGANVIMSDGAFPRFAAEALPFINLFPDESGIEQAISAAAAIPPAAVVRAALDANGIESCARHWQSMLGS
jgi:beta-1,4-mannosyltransferase